MTKDNEDHNMFSTKAKPNNGKIIILQEINREDRIDEILFESKRIVKKGDSKSNTPFPALYFQWHVNRAVTISKKQVLKNTA